VVLLPAQPYLDHNLTSTSTTLRKDTTLAIRRQTCNPSDHLQLEDTVWSRRDYKNYVQLQTNTAKMSDLEGMRAQIIGESYISIK